MIFVFVLDVVSFIFMYTLDCGFFALMAFSYLKNIGIKLSEYIYMSIAGWPDILFFVVSCCPGKLWMGCQMFCLSVLSIIWSLFFTSFFVLIWLLSFWFHLFIRLTEIKMGLEQGWVENDAMYHTQLLLAASGVCWHFLVELNKWN